MGYRFESLTHCYVDILVNDTRREIPLIKSRFISASYAVYALEPERGSSILDLQSNELSEVFVEIDQKIKDKKKGRDVKFLLDGGELKMDEPQWLTLKH